MKTHETHFQMLEKCWAFHVGHPRSHQMTMAHETWRIHSVVHHSYQTQPIGSSKSTGESMTQWWTRSKIFPPNWSKQRKNTCPWTSPEPGKNLRRASVSWAHETPLGSFVIFLWYPWILSAGLALCSCLSGIIKTIQRIPTGIFFGPLGNSNPMSKSISIEINPFQSSEILINSI